MGIEPATDGLQNRCSTAELRWRGFPPCFLKYGATSAGSSRIQTASATANEAETMLRVRLAIGGVDRAFCPAAVEREFDADAVARGRIG